MTRTGAPKVKGVFERPVGSGCWWINYYVDCKQHREKVGRRSDALALYQKRKADARRKVKLPELVRGKTVNFGQLSEMAVKYAEMHLASPDHYKTKDSMLREPFGARPASAITPQEIDEWLSKHCKTNATVNRYRVFFSLAYRLGMENGKVPSNQARLVRLRTEHNARMRFLSRAEYGELLGIIQRVALVHGIDAQKAGLAVGRRLAPLTDLDRRGSRLLVAAQAVARALAQVVEVAVGQSGQPLELRLAVNLELALADVPRGQDRLAARAPRRPRLAVPRRPQCNDAGNEAIARAWARSAPP